MTRALAFVSFGPRDYGSRLTRLRWARAVSAERVVDWTGEEDAEAAVAGAETWTVVTDGAALPLSGKPGSVSHTLRELEVSGGEEGIETSDPPAAMAFRTADFPPEQSETIYKYIRRLQENEGPEVARLPAFVVEDPSDRERPEVVERLPSGPARILDAGCGSGGLALAKTRRPGWKVTGIEEDALLAARARERCDRVLEGDLTAILPKLSAAGERFDAFVFADVLEHLEDPFAALTEARRLAAPGALLVAVVPNVGHLSIARDLLLGRHDPVPAGLCDAGHLRWFTKDFLREALTETGWALESLKGLPGAPPPDPEQFLELSADWPDADRESLLTYQWIATARAR